MAKKLKFMLLVDYLAVVLLLIGGLNWGLFALGFNLVEVLTNMLTFTWLSTLIYALVGLSAVEVIIRSMMHKFMK